MRYLLDTCVISDFAKGEPNAHVRLKAERLSDIAISSVTLMEINYGLTLNPARSKIISPIIQTILQVVTVLAYADRKMMNCFFG